MIKFLSWPVSLLMLVNINHIRPQENCILTKYQIKLQIIYPPRNPPIFLYL